MGLADAQVALSNNYRNGRGVPQSDAKAVKWVRKAAEQGHPLGAHNLSLLYAQGRGVPKSDTESFRWTKVAAEAGHPPAMCNCGVYFCNGTGGARQDYLEALRWIRKSEGLGYPKAAAAAAHVESCIEWEREHRGQSALG